MAERIKWRQKHDALELENKRLQEDLDTARGELQDANNDVAGLKRELDEARAAVSRARIEGMHAASGALLSAE